jgi:Fe-S oxidoreductase
METPTRHEFLHFAVWEKALFYVLIGAALGLMFWQIWGRLKLWRQGRAVEWETVRDGVQYWIPTRKSFRRWADNVGHFVLAQRKVKTSRKRSGAPMHLMIFYGFLALFIATILLGIGTYFPYRFHQGTYYLVYEMTFDLLGLLLIVGVGWAFVRRLRESRRGARRVEELRGETPEDSPMRRQLTQNRRWPMSHDARDYAALGILFMAGVTGYVVEGARMSVNPQPFDWSGPIGYSISLLMGREISVPVYKFFWWFHFAWVAAFFVALPQMRLRHVVMAIFTSAGKPDQAMGTLRPISMEEVEQTEQIGVKLAKDYSRWHLMSLDACMECGRCTEVCPAWNVGKVLNPKQVAQDIRRAMETGEEVAAAVSEEALWQCTTCNACVEACPVLIRHVDLIVDSRRNLVSEGRLSGTAATMLRQTASTSHAWGASADQREDWMKGLDIPLCRDGAEFEFLFWVGCAGATDPGAVRTTKATAQLLKQAGVKFACLGREEACTGDPARRVGEEFLFQEKAAHNASVFERYGVKKVVTACPHCFNTLKNEYGDFEAKVEVFHHSQLLQQLVSKGQLVAARPAKGEVTFHDPCYLGRVNREADAPRATLGETTNLNEIADPTGRTHSGNLAEPVQHGNKTLCCGAGGGRMWMEEPPTQRPSNRRAEQLAATGAKTVAVGCPFCRIMLGDALKQVRPEEEIRLVDLAEMMAEANGAGATNDERRTTNDEP